MGKHVQVTIAGNGDSVAAIQSASGTSPLYTTIDSPNGAYGGLQGLQSGTLQWMLGHFGNADGLSLYTNGTTRAVRFGDDQNTTFFGGVSLPSLKIGTSATAGYVLTADSSGNATWQVSTASGGFTNPMTTKGDLIARDSSGANRLAVGTDNYVLTADSTQATGLKWAIPSDSTKLAISSNLSDLASAATARTNLGLGTAATTATTAYDAAGAATTVQAASLQKTSNLSDLASAATARTNLGLGTAAVISSTAGGDLSGTLPSPTVAKVNGVTISGTPASGSILTATSSTAASWGASIFAPALTATTVKTANYNANANEFVPADAATSGSFTINLPTAPADKTRVEVKKSDTGFNPITIAAGGSDVFNKTGGATTATLTLPNQALTLQYSTTGAIWYVVSDDLPLSQLDTRYASLATGNTFTGNLLQTSATPVFSQASTSILQYATIGIDTYFNTSTFGNNAGVLVGVALPDGTGTTSKFVINKVNYSGLYVSNLMTIDINNAATTFTTSLAPANNNSQNLGVPTQSWANLYSTILTLNSTASITGATAGILSVTGDLRIGTAGTNTASVVTVGGTQTLTGKTLTSPVINTPTGITKSDVGLSNVDNTSDATKLTVTRTLTNARITPRVGTTTSSATPTINTDNYDYYELTAQAVDITSFTSGLTGTPTNGQKLWISITGTAARAIAWGTGFEASTTPLPATTVGTNRLDIGFVWNAVTSKWRCVAAG